MKYFIQITEVDNKAQKLKDLSYSSFLLHSAFCMERPLDQGQKAKQSFFKNCFFENCFFRAKKVKILKNFLNKSSSLSVSVVCSKIFLNSDLICSSQSKFRETEIRAEGSCYSFKKHFFSFISNSSLSSKIHHIQSRNLEHFDTNNTQPRPI